MSKLFKSLLAIVLTFVFTSSASASYGLYAIEDGQTGFHFDYDAYLNYPETGAIAIRNYSDEPITVVIAAVDASVNYETSFGLESTSHNKDTVGAWIELEKPVVEIQGGATESVGFTLLVPLGTAYADYAGGIVVSQRKTDDLLSSSGFHLVSQQALRVYVTAIEGKPEPSMGLSTDLSGQNMGTKSVITVNDGYMYILFMVLALNLLLLMYFVYMQQKVNSTLIGHISRNKKRAN